MFDFYYRTLTYNLTERENRDRQNSDCLFCWSFEDFCLCSLYSNVNYCAWHFCKLLFACSEISLSINERKARNKSRKKSDIIQFGRWLDSFSSVLCSSCPRSLEGIINIRPSIFASQLQSTPFIFGNQLNEDFLRKSVGTIILSFDTSPLETSLG